MAACEISRLGSVDACSTNGPPGPQRAETVDRARPGREHRALPLAVRLQPARGVLARPGRQLHRRQQHRRGGQRLLHRGLPADEVHRRDRAGAPAGVHRRLRGSPAPGAAADRGQHAAPGRQHHRAPGDRRTRRRVRRRGRRARPRRGRHRAERAAPRAGAHPPCRRGGQRGEDAVPGQHEPRGAYAADQRARSDRDPGRGRSRSERPGAGDDRPAQRREAAPPGQRHPRRLASRGRQARRPGDRDQPAGRGRRRDHLGRPAGAQGGADLHLGPRPHPARRTCTATPCASPRCSPTCSATR